MSAVIAAARWAAASDREPDRILNATETAQYLGLSERTLARIRDLPKVRLTPGRVGYRMRDVLGWIEARTTKAA